MFTKVFKLGNEPLVLIQINDDGCRISIISNETEIGYIELEYRQDEDDFGKCIEYYHIMYLALEKCKRQGIGTTALEFHKESFRLPITAARIFGPKMDDGSHLTGDGAPFINAMRRKGVVCKELD